MKKFIKLQLLALFLLSITFQISYSEPGKIGLGLTGGYLNASNDVHYVYSCDVKKFMDNFIQGGYFAGIVLEYPLGLGLGSSIVSKLYCNNFSYSYLNNGESYISIVDDGKGGSKAVNTETFWGWRGNYSLMSLDILPKIKIPFIDLGLFAGLSFSYLINSNYNEKYMISEPDYIQFYVNDEYIKQGYRYTDNNRTMILKEGEIPYKNNFRYSIKAGLNYDLLLSKYTISPFVTIDLPLNSVVNGVNQGCTPEINAIRTGYHWKITYFQFGIDLKYLF